MIDDIKIGKISGMATIVDISDDPTIGRIKETIKTIANDDGLSGTQKQNAIELMEEAMRIIRPT